MVYDGMEMGVFWGGGGGFSIIQFNRNHLARQLERILPMYLSSLKNHFTYSKLPSIDCFPS